ncbi:MAG: M28 family metallopeptidase [Woeseiaceae bacterium]
MMTIQSFDFLFQGTRRTVAGIVCLSTMALLAACGGDQSASVPPPSASGEKTISIERFRADVEALSSDQFGGRLPATEGEDLTVAYLIDGFQSAGLVGGNDGSFVQEVPLVAITATGVSPLRFATEGKALTLAGGEDAVLWTKRVVEKIELEKSPLVFVGYGIVAPEYGWNDYADVDVEGKTVVVLVNDPGFATGNDSLFTGRRMTYYGRWTYKFEEAARQGAAGVIVVHETEAAGYPWSVVTGSWTGEQFDLDPEDGNASRSAIESWISEPAARQLFALSGQDYAVLRDSAASQQFRAIELGSTVSASLTNSIERSKSRNVVATLPGRVKDETVAFSAHWDHLGTVDNGTEDGIYNGAVDNATGTAALLEMARILGASEHRRSYLFIAVTAEEQGLLGSAWYANNPTVSLGKMAGLINIDAMSVIGPTNDVAVIGFGSSSLEDLLAEAASKQDRRLAAESSPEKGFFYRSDHFNFAKKGVPVLYAKSGVDHIEKGREYGLAAAAKHTAERYHQPSDEIHDGWDFGGIEQDLTLYLEVARTLGNSESWPEWREGNEFRATRELSDEERH